MLLVPLGASGCIAPVPPDLRMSTLVPQPALQLPLEPQPSASRPFQPQPLFIQCSLHSWLLCLVSKCVFLSPSVEAGPSPSKAMLLSVKVRMEAMVLGPKLERDCALSQSRTSGRRRQTLPEGSYGGLGGTNGNASSSYRNTCRVHWEH